MLCMVLFFFTAGGAGAQRAEGVETQVAANESYQNVPAIYGDIIVWEDDRNVNPTIDYDNAALQEIVEADVDILAYDIASGQSGYLTENVRMKAF